VIPVADLFVGRVMERRSGESFSEELLEDIRLEIEERKGDHLLDLYRETHPHLTFLQETPPVDLHHAVSAVEVDGEKYITNIMYMIKSQLLVTAFKMRHKNAKN